MLIRSLTDWLDYQQRIHPRSVELGLARVGEVWRRMGAPQPAPQIIVVGGTNGKGSTVAFLEAMLAAVGQRTGCYTSPHLLRYNERVRVLGVDADDATLIDAFGRIEAARNAVAMSPVALTYFEFGTLAALWIFAQSKLDVALLEVGLGGRLDAVNIVDADVAVVTTVDLDHQDWLGNDRDSIGREKAGIFRAGRPAIIGMREPPAGLLTEATRIGAHILRAGHEFDWRAQIDAWQWLSPANAGEQAQMLMLPAPALAAPCQIDNAAAALAALYTLRDTLGWQPQAYAAGVRDARAPARLQRLRKPGAADLVIDVAHNPQAAGVLAQWLAHNPPVGRNVAVFSALGDKDVGGIVAALAQRMATWFIGGLQAATPRGSSATAVCARVVATAPDATIVACADIATALDAAASVATVDDRMLAFGSFFVAAAALEWARDQGYVDASSQLGGYNRA